MTIKTHITLQRAAELQKRIDKLEEQHQHDTDAVKLLIEARNDQVLKNEQTEATLQRLWNLLSKQVAELDSRWRLSSTTGMERYQEVRALQTALMDTNERVHKLESRAHSTDLKIAGMEMRQNALFAMPKPKYSLPREQHVVMYGNPVDGFRIVGPFEDRDEAVKYGESEPSQNDWWIAELDAPAEGEGA